MVFIGSLLDYCTALLYGLPQSSISKLQRRLNGAARFVDRYKEIQPHHSCAEIITQAPCREENRFPDVVSCISCLTWSGSRIYIYIYISWPNIVNISTWPLVSDNVNCHWLKVISDAVFTHWFHVTFTHCIYKIPYCLSKRVAYVVTAGFL